MASGPRPAPSSVALPTAAAAAPVASARTAAVATVQARGTPVAIEHEEEAGALSWMFGSAPQKPAVSTFGVVLERDEEADDGTKHKRKSMAL